MSEGKESGGGKGEQERERLKKLKKALTKSCSTELPSRGTRSEETIIFISDEHAHTASRTSSRIRAQVCRKVVDLRLVATMRFARSTI